MDVFISWDGDHIGREVGRASLEDDAEKIRRISQAIDHGNQIWKSWVESIGGSLISMGGDEGRAQIPAHRLSEVPGIREQYSGAVGSSASVGVGTRLSQADKALLVAKMRGGDRVVLYTPELEDEIEQATAKPKNEVDKLAEEYLDKAEVGPEILEADENSMSSPALHADAGGGGIKGAQRPAAPAKPKGEASEHSQGQAMRAVMENVNPPAPEMTHAAEDLEEVLHQFAEKQDQEDKDTKDGHQGPKDHASEVKEQVLEVLQQVKSQAKVLEEIKQQAPKIYEVIMDMVQAVIVMARELKGGEEQPEQSEGEPTEKSEQEIGQPLQKAIKQIKPGNILDKSTLTPEQQQTIANNKTLNSAKWYDYSHLLDPAHKHEGYRLAVYVGKSPMAHWAPVESILFHKSQGMSVGGVAAEVEGVGSKPKLIVSLADVDKAHRGRGLGQKAYEALYAHALHHFQAKRVMGDVHSSSASAAHQRLADQHGLSYKAVPNRSDWKEVPNKSYDNKFANYNYTLKSEGMEPPKPEDFDPAELKMGVEAEMEHTDNPQVALRIAMDHLREEPSYYTKLKEAGLMEKTDLPMPKAPAHHHVKYPVGSQKDHSPEGTRDVGKVKVQEGEKQKWHEVRAGQIMDASGNPVSSLSPHNPNRGK